jgi:glycerol-3-phosphate dehydrogenase (NAD(P)+)
MATVGLVGTGFHFEILLRLLDATSTRVLLWQPDGVEDHAEDLPEHVELISRERLADVPLIFFSVPIDVCRPIARELGDVMNGRQVVVHMSRSLEPLSLKSVSTILQEETPTHRFGFVTGPVLLEDVKDAHPSSAVCASRFPEVHDLVEECLMSQLFRIYRTMDITGAELCAAYGRIIALISGLADALGMGTSLQSTLFARGVAEMARFVVFREGFERTAFGLAGVGNLHADTHGGGSPAFAMGKFIARYKGKNLAAALQKEFGWRGQDMLSLIEGLVDTATTAGLDVHLLMGAHAVVSGKLKVGQAVEQLMDLPALYE